MPDNNGSELGTLLSDLLENNNLKRRLEVYADKHLRKSTKSKFALHLLPSDLISSIILKLLTGEINWDREKCTLSTFFFSRIRTEIYNLTKKEKKFIPVPVEKSKTISDYEGEIDDDLSEPPQFIINPFEENDDEDEPDPLEITNIAFEIFKDSPEEYLVLDGIYNGLQTKQISQDLGLSKDEVHNIKRRIIRVLKEWAIRNKIGKVPADDLTLSKKTKQLINPFIKEKPGKIIPDNNNNGELI